MYMYMCMYQYVHVFLMITSSFRTSHHHHHHLVSSFSFGGRISTAARSLQRIGLGQGLGKWQGQTHGQGQGQGRGIKGFTTCSSRFISSTSQFLSSVSSSSLEDSASKNSGTSTRTRTRTRTRTVNNHNDEMQLLQVPEFELDMNLPYFPIFYNDVYEVPLPPKHRFPMEKYRKVRTRIQSTIQSFPPNYVSKVQCTFHISPLVSIQNLTTTHCPKYVQRYMEGNQTQREIRYVGFPWSIKGVERSLSSTGGTVAAAVSMCQAKRQHLKVQQQHQQVQVQGTESSAAEKERVDGKKNDKNDRIKMPMVWGAHVAGGTHHAFRDRGEGFCVFSDIAVAANVILRDYPDVVRKILILDLDVHQGNGNSVLFEDNDDVITISMHCSSNYFSKKETSDLDIELPSGCNDATYLSTLYHWLKQITNEMKGDVDFIFFQAGVDILDEDRLGRMDVSQEGIRRRNEMVFQFASDLGCPLCITMGGGYPKSNWEPILNAHANVYIQAFEYLADNQ